MKEVLLEANTDREKTAVGTNSASQITSPMYLRASD